MTRFARGTLILLDFVDSATLPNARLQPRICRREVAANTSAGRRCSASTRTITYYSLDDIG